ncbi:MAG TPA: hypothetical protein VHR86_06210, partial [Armatimonadota bacterium]|nr:hypothetical protein [Armatimonadota bacterium]
MKTMKSPARNRSLFSIALLGLLVLLTASACTFTGIPVAHGDSIDIQATFNESDINTLLAHSHQQSNVKEYDLLDEITSVDMQ